MLYRRSTSEIYEGHKYTRWERTHFYDGNVGGTIKQYLFYKRFNTSVVFSFYTVVRQRKKLLSYIPHSKLVFFHVIISECPIELAWELTTSNCVWFRM